MNPLHAHDRIVAALHKATLDPARWPAGSALIDEASAPAPISASPASTNAANAAWTWSASISSTTTPLTNACRASASFPPARLVHVPDLYHRPQELKTSIAYNEGLRRLGVQNGIGVRLDGLRIF